jgi:hypothetical protein
MGLDMRLDRSLATILLLLSFLPLQLAVGQSPNDVVKKSEREDQVREALIYYLARGWTGNDRVFFVSIEGRDPSDEFLLRLKKLKNPIKKVSESKDVPEEKGFFSHVKDKATDRPGVVFSVGKIVWVSKNRAEVEGSYRCGSLCGGGSRYRIKYELQKKWTVAPGDTVWNS